MGAPGAARVKNNNFPAISPKITPHFPASRITIPTTEPPDLVAWYIWMNPVRAGLCTSVTDYPWAGSLTGAGPKTTLPSKMWSPPWRSQGAPI
jgi:hypothetical protein